MLQIVVPKPHCREYWQNGKLLLRVRSGSTDNSVLMLISPSTDRGYAFPQDILATCASWVQEGNKGQRSWQHGDQPAASGYGCRTGICLEYSHRSSPYQTPYVQIQLPWHPDSERILWECQQMQQPQQRAAFFQVGRGFWANFTPDEQQKTLTETLCGPRINNKT